jgi:hypothetical protein
MAPRPYLGALHVKKEEKKDGKKDERKTSPR